MSGLQQRRAGLAILAVAVGALVIATGHAADEFTLTKAIPADAFFAVHTRQHEGLKFVRAQYARVWKALEDAHLEREFKRLLKDSAQQGGGDPEQFEQRWQQVADALAGVDWATLGEREAAFAAKLEFPAPQWVVLLKPPADKLAGDFDSFAALLEMMAGISPQELDATSETIGKTDVRRLSFVHAPFPITFVVARHEDTLMLAFGTTMVEQCLALLGGEAGQTLASTPRFKEAFAQLPPPGESLFFMDVEKFLLQIRSFASAAMQLADPGGETLDPRARPRLDPKMRALPDKLIDAVDLFEYAAAVTRTEGMRTEAESVLVLREDARSRPLYKALFGTPPVSQPLKFVPRDANDVSIWSGFDFAALYRTLLDFVTENVPSGDVGVTHWQELQRAWGLDVEQDLLSWLGGGMYSFKIPGPMAYSATEFALLIDVRDEDKAREMLDRFFEFLEPKLAPQSGTIADAEVEGAEGFRSVLLPLMAMIGVDRPTAGVAQGKLIIGSSPKVISRALRTAAGSEPSFVENERFEEEGLKLADPVVAFSFTDLTKLGEELSQMLAMVPMVGMVNPELMKAPPARAIVSTLSKLSPVVRQLDFFQSSCSQTTSDGRTYRTKSITNYRKPPTRPVVTTQPSGQPE